MRVVVVRGGLGLLAALNIGWGAWAVTWPQHFFSTFPGFGHRWTSAYPPYNEHLVVDLGATFLTLGFLLAVAAIQRERRVRVVVLAGVIVFNALHLIFHATHRGTMSMLDYAMSSASLLAGVVGPLALLLIDRRGQTSHSRRVETDTVMR